MSSDNGHGRPMVERLFRGSALFLGAVIALNLSIAYLRPVVPWLVGAMSLGALVWLVVAIVRWRRSRW